MNTISSINYDIITVKNKRSKIRPLFYAMKNIVDLYKTKRWEKVRQEQLEADHFECQRCKHQGVFKDLPGLVKYTRATLVHHEFRVRQFPQYVYKRYVGNTRNTYSLCETCHEIIHKGERSKPKEIEELNKEKW